MLDCPVEYEPYTMACHNCGSEFFDYRTKGPHMAVYCVSCGSFITYVPKKDLALWKRKVKERDLENGITLCKKCHNQLHGIDGTIKDYKEDKENAET